MVFSELFSPDRNCNLLCSPLPAGCLLVYSWTWVTAAVLLTIYCITLHTSIYIRRSTAQCSSSQTIRRLVSVVLTRRRLNAIGMSDALTVLSPLVSYTSSNLMRLCHVVTQPRCFTGRKNRNLPSS